MDKRIVASLFGHALTFVFMNGGCVFKVQELGL